jgi:hypothetical protein
MPERLTFDVEFIYVILVVVRVLSNWGEIVNCIVLRFWQLQHSSFSSGFANKRAADFSLLSEHIIYKIIAEKLYAN